MTTSAKTTVDDLKPVLKKILQQMELILKQQEQSAARILELENRLEQNSFPAENSRKATNPYSRPEKIYKPNIKKNEQEDDKLAFSKFLSFLCFSNTGRINRTALFFGLIFIGISSSFLSIILTLLGVSINSVTYIVTFLIITPVANLYVKRLYDRNRSGWFALLLLVPLLQLWPFVEGGFLHGRNGENKFGIAPRDDAAFQEALRRYLPRSVKVASVTALILLSLINGFVAYRSATAALSNPISVSRLPQAPGAPNAERLVCNSKVSSSFLTRTVNELLTKARETSYVMTLNDFEERGYNVEKETKLCRVTVILSDGSEDSIHYSMTLQDKSNGTVFLQIVSNE